MRDFVVMTDSCCDLPLEYIEKYNIPTVNLTFTIEGREYYDDFGKSLNYKKFYEAMRKGEIPKTSQPNADAYYKVFKSIAEKGKDILYVCVSSGLSGAYNSANIGKNMILDEFSDTRVEIVDILTASLGQGIMVLKALEMKEKGSSIGEIVEYLEGVKPYLNTYMIVDDLNHLKRGGRISTTAAIVGTVLHIKPLLTLNDEGKVIAIRKVKGRKSAINDIAKIVIDKIENPEEQMISISHGDVEMDGERLRDAILKEAKVKDVLFGYVGTAVGAYGGPGALAVTFIGKRRQNHIIDVNL